MDVADSLANRRPMHFDQQGARSPHALPPTRLLSIGMLDTSGGSGSERSRKRSCTPDNCTRSLCCPLANEALATARCYRQRGPTKTSAGLMSSMYCVPRISSYDAKPPSPFCRDSKMSTAQHIRSAETGFPVYLRDTSAQASEVLELRTHGKPCR